MRWLQGLKKTMSAKHDLLASMSFREGRCKQKGNMGTCECDCRDTMAYKLSKEARDSATIVVKKTPILQATNVSVSDTISDTVLPRYAPDMYRWSIQE